MDLSKLSRAACLVGCIASLALGGTLSAEPNLPLSRIFAEAYPIPLDLRDVMSYTKNPSMRDLHFDLYVARQNGELEDAGAIASYIEYFGIGVERMGGVCPQDDIEMFIPCLLRVARKRWPVIRDGAIEWVEMKSSQSYEEYLKAAGKAVREDRRLGIAFLYHPDLQVVRAGVVGCNLDFNVFFEHATDLDARRWILAGQLTGMIGTVLSLVLRKTESDIAKMEVLEAVLNGTTESDAQSIAKATIAMDHELAIKLRELASARLEAELQLEGADSSQRFLEVLVDALSTKSEQ